MIRGLLVGIVRIFFWMIAFYFVSSLVKWIIAAFSSRSPKSPLKPPFIRTTGTQKPAVEYRDVQDAEFKEVKE